MSLEKIINKIEKEGEQEIKNIELEGEKEAKKILDNARKMSEEFAKNKYKETQKIIENLKIQENSVAELEAKKIRLNAEKEILDNTYKECLIALNSISHKNVLHSLFIKVRKNLPDAYNIYSNKRDEDFVKSNTNLNYCGNINCIGGIIVENKEKTMKLDYRYETIAFQVWDDSIKEIAHKLFR